MTRTSATPWRRAAALSLAALLLTGTAACSSDDDADGPITSTTAPAHGASSTTEASGSDGSESASVGPFEGDWETVTPAEVGLDAVALDRIAGRAETDGSNCLLVVRHGRIAGEWYWNGTDEHRDQEVFSATKSYASVLVGIAQDEGALEIDDSASTWIPEWQGTESEAVTVRNLLSNDSGRFWSLGSDYGQLVQSPDKTAYAVGLEQADPPGTTWAYNNSAIQTLDQVVEEATGTPFADYGQEKLLDPLGMADSRFKTDAAGNGLAFMGLNSTCRDMARFGLMVLHDGRWGDQQVVSAEYLADATGQASQDLNGGYGLLFWLNRKGVLAGPVSPTHADGIEDAPVGQMVPDAPDDLIWALGLGAQIIQVHHETDTVVVRLGPATTNSPYSQAETARVVTDAIAD